MQDSLFGSRGGNIVFTRAALRQAQIAGHYNQLNSANTVQFSIDGVFKTLAPVDNQAFSSGHANLAVNQACVFGVYVNSTNTVSTQQSAVVNSASVGVTDVIPLPPLPIDNSSVLIGMVKVQTTNAATFVPGTTNLNAANVTVTYYDVTVPPSKPFNS
jgi:hypothetical protein